MSKSGVHLIIEGRVQGVGFRYFSQRAGNNNNLTGYVRNLPDGNVEIEAEGDLKNIYRFINTLRIGHPYAKVFDIKQSKIPYTGVYKNFSIKY